MTRSFQSAVRGTNYTHHNSDFYRPTVCYQKINMVIYHWRVQGVTTQLYNHPTWRALTGRRCMTTKLEGYTVCHIQARKISSLKSRLCLSVCASLSKSVKYLKAAAAQFLSLLFFFFFWREGETHIWTDLWLGRLLFGLASWACGICWNINESEMKWDACVFLKNANYQWGKFHEKPCNSAVLWKQLTLTFNQP